MNHPLKPRPVPPLPPFLADQAALDDFVRAWEECTLPAASWTHAAHVSVAAYYAFDHTPEDCFRRMKTGILRFNVCTGVENTPQRGYHETLTRFWSGLVSEFVRAGKFSSRLHAVRGAVAEFGDDRSRYRAYYSFDAAKDRRARQDWIPPDLQP